MCAEEIEALRCQHDTDAIGLCHAQQCVNVVRVGEGVVAEARLEKHVVPAVGEPHADVVCAAGR